MKQTVAVSFTGHAWLPFVASGISGDILSLFAIHLAGDTAFSQPGLYALSPTLV